MRSGPRDEGPEWGGTGEGAGGRKGPGLGALLALLLSRNRSPLAGDPLDMACSGHGMRSPGPLPGQSLAVPWDAVASRTPGSCRPGGLQGHWAE